MPDNSNSLKAHAKKIGLPATIKLAKFSLTYIETNEQQIKQALLDSDRQLAATYAHRAMGSVRFYGSVALESLLEEVSDNNYASTRLQSLRQDVSAEFALARDNLNHWLSNAENHSQI